MLIDDYVAKVKSRATNPEYPLDLLNSVEQEFRKALRGGCFDTSYVLKKLEALKLFVVWLDDEYGS